MSQQQEAISSSSSTTIEEGTAAAAASSSSSSSSSEPIEGGGGDPQVLIATLQSALQHEKIKTKNLQEEVKTLRSELVNLQALAEQEDEYRVNKLSKNLDQVKKEKQDLLVQVEREEEYITNTLVKKLEQVRREKIDLENQLEQEEEFITNKLQKQLLSVMNDKSKLEKKLEAETSDHERLAKLESEISVLRSKLTSLQLEHDTYEKKNDSMKDQLLKLKTENFALAQRIKREQERLVQVNEDKLRLMSNIEMGDERRYNTRTGVRARSVSLPAEPKLLPSSLLKPTSSTPKSSPGKQGPSSSSLAPPHSPPSHARSPPSPMHPSIPHQHQHHIIPKSLQGRELIATPVRVRDPNAHHHHSHPTASSTSAAATTSLPIPLIPPPQQRVNSMEHRSYAALRDMGARTFLQLWRLEEAYTNTHTPDLAYDLSSVSAYTLDKNDPRCLTISFSSSTHASPTQKTTAATSSATTTTSTTSTTAAALIDQRVGHSIDGLTLTFDKEEQAEEWFSLLKELSV